MPSDIRHSHCVKQERERNPTIHLNQEQISEHTCTLKLKSLAQYISNVIIGSHRDDIKYHHMTIQS